MVGLKRATAGLVISCLAFVFSNLQRAYVASAQTLARPGWAGSGIRSDPWWRHAVIYDVADNDPLADPDVLNARLDGLRSLGVDAIVMPAPELELDPAKIAASKADTAGPEWMNSFDDLVHQAGARGVRILVRVPVPHADNAAGTVRMWLSHGVAGLYLLRGGESPSDYSTAAEAVRKLVAAAPGHRVVLMPLDGIDSDPPHIRGPVNLLYVNIPVGLGAPTAANIRPILERTLMNSNGVLELGPQWLGTPEIRDILATVALTFRPAGLIPSGLLPDPGGKGASAKRSGWITELAALHHSSPTLRYGQTRMLDFDAEGSLIWVVQPPSGMGMNGPLVIACNLRPNRIQLPLSEALARMHFSGRFLHSVVQSGPEGTQDPKSLEVPGYGVYIGELRK